MKTSCFVRFNPGYWLRQDGNRVILLGESSKEWNSEEWFLFIHPYHAMMFSFFEGRMPFERELENCAKFFNLPLNRMKEIVSLYLNNTKCVKIRQKNGNEIGFPKNVLMSCSKVENESGTAKFNPLNFKFSGNPDYDRLRLHFPINLNFELTMKCYADCRYCYANRQLRDQTLVSLDIIKKLIKEAKENGIYKFDINGGEVLLHPNIKEILRELIYNGYKPLVSTKMPVPPTMLDYLKSVGLKKFQMSLDATDENILKKMIGVQYGYIDKIYDTLKYAETIGLEIEINTVITKFNSEISVLERLIEKLSCFNNIRILRLSPYGYSIYKKKLRRTGSIKKSA